jgi:hypothetical protein
MQRARRLALVAVLPILGVLALTGCRSEPGVAAYVGAKKYTIEQVDALAREVEGRVRDFGNVRQTVLSWLIIRETGWAELQRRNLNPAAGDPTGPQIDLQLPAGSPLAQLAADQAVVVSQLLKTVTPAEPTEADQRAVYGLLDAGGRALPPFEEVRQYLTKESIGAQLALRSELSGLLKAANVQVNPRYAPLVFPIGVQIGQVPGSVLLPRTPGSMSPVTGASASA